MIQYQLWLQTERLYSQSHHGADEETEADKGK